MCLKLILVLAACMMCVSAQSFSPYKPDDIDRNNVIQDMPTMLAEWATRALASLTNTMQLKLRFVKFFAGLYTEQNLAHFRKFLRILLRFGNWFYDIIPTSKAEGASRFIKYLFPTQKTQMNNPYEYDRQDSLSNTDEDRATKLAAFLNSGQVPTTAVKPTYTSGVSSNDATVDDILGQLDINAIING